MIASSQLARWEDLRSLGHASLSSSYVGIGGSFTQPVRLIEIDNTTDANLIISFDGVNAKRFISANTGKVLDIASDRNDIAKNLEQPVGDRIYVKLEAGSTATVGNVYVAVMYAGNH